MKQKKSFINLFQLLGLVLLVGIGFSTTILNIVISTRDFNAQAEQMRTDYIDQQKKIVKQEVMRAVAMIKHEQNRSLKLAKKTVKSRIYEACSIAESIYKRYYGVKNAAEIQEIIIEVLRPIRFDNGNGYLFIRRLDGVSMLHPILPEIEGRHFNDFRDPEKRQTAKNMLAIIASSGEGFSEYKWDKPLVKDEIKRKITFVKLFPRYNWEIGSGIYLEDIEKNLKADTLQRISEIRYGKEGYIFVNRLNGDLLVSNGKLFTGTEKLWEAFNKNPEKVKDLFAMEHAAALKPEGDYIYYSWIKLTDPDQQSPKTSFILCIPELKWLVGAGVYLDDVESEIALMQSKLNSQIKTKMLYSALLFIGVIALFLFFFNRLSRRLKNDFNLFISFFDRAASNNEMINRDQIKLIEFDQMAKDANRMQEKIRQSEAQLRENEQRLRTLINSTPDIICFKDAEGRWLEANDADLKLFSLTQVDYRGKTDSELANFTAPLYKEAFLTCEESDEKAWQAEGVSRNEETIPQPDGTSRVFDVIKVSIFHEDGSRKGLVVLGRDITEQKQAEAELQKMAKLKSIGTLAGGIAHDFNNILMALFGNISIAKEELDETHPAFTFLEEAEKSMSRATSLTKQLLTFAKGGAPIKKNISLGELVSEVTSFDLSGSNVKLIFKPAPDLRLADVDQGQMQQVFSNLTINANQAMPDGGHLYITLENTELSTELSRKSLSGLKPGMYIRIVVQDEGCGIDQTHLERIFDPYFTTKQTGSGLGLATTYSIIKRHDGHIKVESELGKGSIFTIHLPASESEILSKTEKTSSHTTPLSQSARILVMDDEENICEVTSRILQKSGYEVKTVNDGRQAITLYKESLAAGKPFTAVIMDLTIPGGMGGQETIKEILALDPDARVIVSSGYAEDPVMANFSDYGFRGFATKPYTIKQLQEALHLVMQ